MSIGNDVVSSDFLKVLLALKDNIMRDLHCNDIGIVVSTSGNECVCKLLSNPDIKISCTKINNIITDKDDVVFIAYTDINSKHNAKQLSDQKDLRNQTIGNKHAYENAVIVLNYSKQGSGEGVTVDSSFSTTSTNALQNKVITNRFNQVESRLINVDSALSSTSTNPVQNKVLYNPVVFAESERQKSITDGAIVHEKEIADVEHIETIYDMSSSDSNINWGNTAGIPLYDALNIVHDFSGFKKYDFIYEPNTRSDNWYGSCRTITVHDAIAGDWVFTYFDCVSPSSCYAENLGGMEIYTQFRMAYDKQSVSVISSKINSDGNHSNIASGYSNFYRLIKIVGYK